MERRGFLGAIGAALAASRLAPSRVDTPTPTPAPRGFVASGVVLMNYSYEHRGVTITRRDDSVDGGMRREHLGKDGVLVGVSFPNGNTVLYNEHDPAVRKSLRSFNHPDYDDHSQPFVDRSRL